ncbi:PLP-dependent aminotransferase family protein [Variovorax sp. J22R133]|uniref:aminotransferase-like domain-containing protein n=1 Tax=Variovorax brevis TaxID=3053503 RepID=UPI002575FA1E|nr:PLP-dependent aminotransferase family protein [Variovorax sp. J22R133]MDM0115142.1 PLP-dependent aminotransferase family protein [Variovorax sp. J22R133]
MKRYEALAADMEASIRNGTLRTGDRLPSVRHTGESRGVSASTVFKAYYLLEARGLIRARDRSGYYVARGGKREALPEAEATSRPVERAVPLDVSDHVFEILEASMTRKVVPFGSAFPSPVHFPLERLGQFMARSAKSLDPWSTVDDLTPGSAALRRQISLRYLADGFQVHTDEIVITNGALEALNLCLAAVTRPGDSVIVESPTFYAALQALERLGLKAIEVPTHAREGIDLDALERAIVRRKPAACWLMTTFQNPLGSSMPQDKKQSLVQLLAQHGIPLIEDDVYAELYFGDKRPLPAKAFDAQGLVMHCSSFSKSLAPGYRVGWVAAGQFARKVAHQKLTTTLSTSAPTQAALAGYLESGGFDRHLRKLRHALATQQTTFMQALGHHFPAGTRATRPLGGYFLWVELPRQVDALEVHRRALALGISVAPGPIFSATRGFTNCLRLNYGHVWDARSEKAMASLGRLIAELA